eukprot:snap_masked-scaffold_17-processed-gene-5.34-mRNA-1 protein AED:1.00 eAED:1.00 QI:0/-1/0/0/-1/1/1/0/64
MIERKNTFQRYETDILKVDQPNFEKNVRRSLGADLDRMRIFYTERVQQSRARSRDKQKKQIESF